ncbi:MAG: hypothetical protein ABJ215_00595 [Alphaproteobacteria bacterium]
MSYRELLNQKLRDAPVHSAPFPHVQLTDVLPEDVLADILAHWPQPDEFEPEWGNSTRGWRLLVHDDKIFAPPGARHQEFWESVTRSHLTPFIEALAERFSPFWALRYGGPVQRLNVVQLCCFTASPEFVFHPPHHHSNHGPHWLFTGLLYLDDNGGVDRGTRLYRVNGLETFRDREFYNLLANDGAAPVEPAHDSGFRTNGMLAFLDSPVSFHGSTPFDTNVDARGERKIIRMHVAASLEDFQRAFGIPSPDEYREAVSRYRETHQPETLEPYRNQIEREEQLVMSRNQGPATHY